MKKLKTAVIGQGRSGRDIHGKFFKSEENVYIDVAAVIERDADRRERALKEYPGCEVMEDYRELYGRDDIELVVNASYSNEHYSITKDLLSHGFNVVVEKPFARNYYECSDLIKTADDNGVTLAVFQQSFLAPYYIAAKEAADSGMLGDIKQVSVHFNGFARRWDWQTTQVMMGGGIYNTGPHPIGIGLAFLDFDDRFKVEYSKLGLGLTSGDAEDYAKIILSAPGKPVIDVEVSSIDAFSDFNPSIISPDPCLDFSSSFDPSDHSAPPIASNPIVADPVPQPPPYIHSPGSSPLSGAGRRRFRPSPQAYFGKGLLGFGSTPYYR